MLIAMHPLAIFLRPWEQYFNVVFALIFRTQCNNISLDQKNKLMFSFMPSSLHHRFLLAVLDGGQGES